MTLLLPGQQAVPVAQPRPTWHFVVADTHGRPIGEITSATQRQASFIGRDACSVSWQMDAMHPQALFVQEAVTDLLLYRDQQLMFRGRIGSSQDTLGSPNMGGGGGTDPDAHIVQFSALDYRGMLGYRFIGDPGFTYTNTDQAAMCWQIIAASEGLGTVGLDWGIRWGTWKPSVNRTIATQSGTTVMQQINDISSMDQGFDWEIDPLLRFNSWPTPAGGVNLQGRGQSIGMQLTYGDNVMAALRAIDTTQYANAVRYAGAGSLVSNVDVVSAGISPTWPTEGQWQAVDSNTNITDQLSLNAAALGDLTFRSELTPSYSLTLTHGWWNPNLLWLGDNITVNINHGRLSESLVTRVAEIDLYLGDNANEETIVVVTGRRQGSVLRTVPRTEKTIQQIAKRV